LEELICSQEASLIWKAKVNINNEWKTAAAKQYIKHIDTTYEVETWQKLQHENIVSLYAASDLYLIMEIGEPLAWYVCSF
jgi:hypothetical protein